MALPPCTVPFERVMPLVRQLSSTRGDVSLPEAGQLGHDLRTQPGRNSCDAVGPGLGGEYELQVPYGLLLRQPAHGRSVVYEHVNQVVKNSFRIAN